MQTRLISCLLLGHCIAYRHIELMSYYRTWYSLGAANNPAEAFSCYHWVISYLFRKTSRTNLSILIIILHQMCPITTRPLMDLSHTNNNHIWIQYFSRILDRFCVLQPVLAQIPRIILDVTDLRLGFFDVPWRLQYQLYITGTNHAIFVKNYFIRFIPS